MELEQERQSIEEDKAQVDRYKQLLLKQRDIMIALTARLNERDESVRLCAASSVSPVLLTRWRQIVALQEELDAYDRHQRMMEDILDQKTAMLIHWQRVAMEGNPDVRKLLVRSPRPPSHGAVLTVLAGGAGRAESGRAPDEPDRYAVLACIRAAHCLTAVRLAPPAAHIPLITEKRYSPYADAVVSNDGAGSAPLQLNAEEKIQVRVARLMDGKPSLTAAGRSCAVCWRCASRTRRCLRASSRRSRPRRFAASCVWRALSEGR
jgi:kinesin family protein 3/17